MAENVNGPATQTRPGPMVSTYLEGTDVTNDSKASGRPFIPARPTVYNGIKMRSRLEASYAQELDECGCTWEYEPQCFASPQGQYLPDFLVTVPPYKRSSGFKAYVEVKPAYLLEDEAAIDAVRYRMEIIWASEPGVRLELVFPGTGHWWRTVRGRWFYEAPGTRSIVCAGCALSHWPGKGCSDFDQSVVEAARYGWRIIDGQLQCPPCVAANGVASG